MIAEDIIFTRHDDGTITADHFPKYTRISVALLEIWNAPGLRATELSVCGQRYRVGEPEPTHFACVLERVDD